tara:strand:+ start:417 stop:533 length:117 start_codon:yes stop_codon:yes gene_type:complete
MFSIKIWKLFDSGSKEKVFVSDVIAANKEYTPTLAPIS